MVRTRTTFEVWTFIGSMLFAGMLATAGCTTDDECVGAGCLSPIPDEPTSCDKLCDHLFEVCEAQPLKLAVDHPSATINECVTLCEKGFDDDERLCLGRIDCDNVPICFEGPSSELD